MESAADIGRLVVYALLVTLSCRARGTALFISVPWPRTGTMTMTSPRQWWMRGKEGRKEGRIEGNVLFNDALNTFHLRLYMASDIW